jgi:glycosyltransferase involved in cell wall biosynthesis
VGDVFEGYEWFEAELRAAVSEFGLENIVRFEGLRANGAAAFADADIALVPSRTEPFGNTAVEAQLCGTPVIVSDRDGLPETVGGGRRGEVIVAEDPIALADAVERLVADWDTALARADTARRECANLFSTIRYHEEVVRVLSEVSGAAGHARHG